MSRRIVVGVDGSEASVAALRWALEEGRLWNAPVAVVSTWRYPWVGDVSAVAYPLDPKDFEEAAIATIDEALGKARALSSDRVERIVTCGSAAETLIDAAGDDGLLVVGSRGHGGFAGLLLGSVSQQCASHARCPVVIVRPGPADRA
jgi:nucleotide-binding universal stress UspA family protein